MREHDLGAAAALLTQSLLEHNADDWSGYIMLMACKLPATALPFHDAVPGVFELEGGFARLADSFCSEAFWEAAPQLASADEIRARIRDLAATFSSLQDRVRCIMIKGGGGTTCLAGSHSQSARHTLRQLSVVAS